MSVLREFESEFHFTGPATEKARRPNVMRRCRGIINWRVAAADRSDDGMKVKRRMYTRAAVQ